MPMKKCSRCNTEKELTEFYKSIIGKKGEQLYKSGCIQCRRVPEKVWEPKEKKKYKDTRVNRIRKPKTQEQVRRDSKKYYDTHRDELCQKQRDRTLLKKLSRVHTENVVAVEQEEVL